MSIIQLINVEAQCRICFSTDKIINLLKPCRCSGTLAYFHKNCLRKWIEVSFPENSEAQCEICKEKIQYKIFMKIECKLNQDKNSLFIGFILIFLFQLFLLCTILFLIYFIEWSSLFKTVVLIVLILLLIILLYPLLQCFKQAFLSIQDDWIIKAKNYPHLSINLNSQQKYLDKTNRSEFQKNEFNNSFKQPERGYSFFQSNKVIQANQNF